LCLSKEWFQDEQDHNDKVDAITKAAQRRYKQASGKKKDDGWNTVAKRR